jgi:hypothetical protein
VPRGEVRIAETKNARASVLFERSYTEVETIEAPGRAGRSGRSETASATVLARFVDKLVSDPDLEQKLAAFQRLAPAAATRAIKRLREILERIPQFNGL